MIRSASSFVRSCLWIAVALVFIALLGDSASARVFSFRPPAGARLVSVAGSFNQWSVNANPLADPDGDGVWTADVSIPAGKHLYKFVVNGMDWMADPGNTTNEDDGMGGTNSVLVVSASASASTAASPGGTGAAAGSAGVAASGTAAGGTAACPYCGRAIVLSRSDVTVTATPAVSSQSGATAVRPATTATAVTPAAPSGGTTFSYRAPAGTRSVAAAGSFNNWSSSASMLTDPDGDGVWTLTTRLQPGSYQYKFVINGSDWKEDPANPKKAEDGLGGTNSVIDVTAAGTTQAAASGGTTFSYRAPAGTRSVAAAGSFNNWSSSANMLADPDGDGVWTVTTRLQPGSYQYKFVINGSDWKEDPANPKKADDGQGGTNSVIDVTAAGSSAGTTAAAAVTTASQSGATPPASGATFSFRAPAGTRSVAAAGSFNNWSTSATPLADPDGDGVWTSNARVPAGTHQYKFVVNGTDWILDPANSNKSDDGYGGQNSVLQVSALSAPAATATSAATAPAGVAVRAEPPVTTPQSGASPVASAVSAIVAATAQEFGFHALPGTRSVALAGTFNNWNSRAVMLADSDGDGVWTAVLTLAPGRHEYKYVINGMDWVRDPANPSVVADGAGGENSLLVVEDPGGALANAHAPPVTSASSVTAVTDAGERDLWAVEPLHRFTYRPAEGAGTVAVAGSFNNWSTTATPMADADGDGEWTADLKLPEGRISYKYVVNGRDWVPDPLNPEHEPDGVGGQNSVIAQNDVVNAGPESHRGDGLLDDASITHGRDARWVTRTETDAVIVTLRLDRDDAESIALVIGDRRSPLALLTEDGRFEYWRGSVRVPADTFHYWFLVEDGDRVFGVDRSGAWLLPREDISEYLRLAADPEHAFALSAGGVFQTPRWVKDAVFYQIFPDRFSNGDPGNDPAEQLRAWRSETLPESSEGWNANYGGDLAGVRARLNYLESLGVTALKFNPIFAAPSVAKYDATDYTQIDPAFGDRRVFDGLVGAARTRGMRIVLDGVFNHSGDQHPYFRDAAQRGPESPYYTWYNILKWPFPPRFEGSGANAPSNFYECWWGFGQLPAWNTRNDAVRDYLIGAAEDWSRAGIGGWRLDAANEVEPEFWREFRTRIKAVDPDQYLVGEIWENAADQLQGDQFDATMNYPLRAALLDFFITEKIDAPAFAARIGKLIVSVPPQAQEVMYNHLSSHDVPRIMTLANGDALRVRQAADFIFAFAGAPVIYYGDEVGLEGAADPDNRRAFPWNDAHVDSSLRDHYTLLARLRREHPILKTSTWIPVLANDRVLVVARIQDGRYLLEIFNAGATLMKNIRFALPSGFPVGVYRNLLRPGSTLVVAGREIELPRLEPRESAFYER